MQPSRTSPQNSWTEKKFLRPSRGTEFREMGATLRTHNATDRGYAGDKETTDPWAHELRPEGWYGWQMLRKVEK